MPQARTDKQPTYLSPSLSLFFLHTLCGTKWSATPNKSLRYRATAGINLSAPGSSRILSLLLAGSKSNKQEDKWRAKRKRGEKREQRGKTGGLLLPTSSIRWTDTRWPEVKAQIKEAEDHHLWDLSCRVRPLTSFLHSAWISTCKSLSHYINLPTTFFHLPWLLLSLWLSICLQFLTPVCYHSLSLFFLHLNPHSLNCFLLSWATLLDPICDLLSSCYLRTAYNTFYTTKHL